MLGLISCIRLIKTIQSKQEKKPMKPKPYERIMAKVKINELTDCWIWMGAKGPRGGGAIRVNGKVTSPRRLMYYIEKGPIPAGRKIGQTCGNPLCVNPNHLYVSDRERKKNQPDKPFVPAIDFASGETKQGWTPEARNEKNLQRLMEKIEIDESTQCWNWTGAINANGYGNFFLDGKYIAAHRASYQIHKGPIPAFNFVLHGCDNPRCINPEHLFVGTQKDNMDDMTNKNRRSQGQPHSVAIKNGWTTDVRDKHSKWVKSRRAQEHNALADAAGVPRDWKYCSKCQKWYPRSVDYWHRNSSRKYGLHEYCKSCRSLCRL
jgi:hypothetical protein